MNIGRHDFLIRARLDAETLDVWVEERWLAPVPAGAGAIYSELDLARARLIHELMDDLGVNDDGVGIILSLLDQMYTLRKVLLNALERSATTANSPGDGSADSSTDHGL